MTDAMWRKWPLDRLAHLQRRQALPNHPLIRGAPKDTPAALKRRRAISPLYHNSTRRYNSQPRFLTALKGARGLYASKRHLFAALCEAPPRTCHVARYASMRSTSSGSSPSDVAAARASTTRPSRTSLPSASALPSALPLILPSALPISIPSRLPTARISSTTLLIVPRPSFVCLSLRFSPDVARKRVSSHASASSNAPHKRGDVAAVPRQGTHVDLAKAAPGDPAGLPHDPVHMIRRAGGSEGAELADKHYADVRDVPEAPSRQRPVDRHQGGAVARPPLVVPVPRAPRLHAREPTAWELAGGVEHRRASPQARGGDLRSATISRQQKDMVGYNCVFSKARSWRIGIRNSLVRPPSA